MLVKQGVYIGKNIEIVISEKYTLVFVSVKNTLVSLLLKTPGLSCIHVIQTTHEHGQISVEYLLTKQGGMNYVKGEKLIKLKGKKVINITQTGDSLHCVIDYLQEEFWANVHEYFTSETLEPKTFSATSESLKKCLNEWHLGVYEIVEKRQNKTFFNGIVLNTPKHMYLYKAMAGGQVYTRAARYCCDCQGIVFDQNFRQYYDCRFPGSAHHVIARDNRMAMHDLSIKNECFHAHSCNIDGNTFYWSVESYEPYKIILNGCDGKQYYWMPKMQRH